MSKPIITMRQYMTVDIQTIQANATIEEAQNQMAKFHFRHLPILDGKKLIGIISDRDIKLAHSLFGVEASIMKVKEHCILAPYFVESDTPLDVVADKMAQNSYGSVIIMDNNKVVGIFTTVDACNALVNLIRNP